MGTRKVPFSQIIYIESEDFREDPPSKFFRLAPGREVRLRYAYYVTCVGVIKDPVTDEITEIHCTYDPKSKGGSSADGRRVRGTLHWVSAKHSLNAEVRLYNTLLSGTESQDANRDNDVADNLNPDSLDIVMDCQVEPSLLTAVAGVTYQFERQGYFCIDSEDSDSTHLVFNRTVQLRDSWAKVKTA